MSGLGSQTAAAVEALAFSGRPLASSPRLVRSLGLVKAAAAAANVAADVVPAATGAAIERQALGLAEGRHHERLVADLLGGGGGIGVHHNVNELLADLAGAPVTPADVGASQSTADVCHTAARLSVGAALDDLDAAIEEVVRELEAFAERAADVPTLARTCLQDALAVPASLLLEGTVAALDRRAGSLRTARAALDHVVLGATVVGTGAGATDRYREAVVPALARHVDRPLRPHPHPASALQSADDLVDLSGRLVALGTVLGKLGSDLRLLASGPVGGLGEVRLPAVVEGSTFFQAKANPVVPETVVQAAIVAAGAHQAVLGAAGRGELHLHGWDLTVAVGVLDAADALAAASRQLARRCLAGAALDEARCRALAAAATPTRHDADA